MNFDMNSYKEYNVEWTETNYKNYTKTVYTAKEAMNLFTELCNHNTTLLCSVYYYDSLNRLRTMLEYNAPDDD